MKILQANLHRSRMADDLLSRFILELQADLMIISEQYRDRDVPGWFTDTLGTAAIWVVDPRKTPIDEHGSGRGFVWVRSAATYYVSCYFTPTDHIQDFQNKIDELEDALRDTGGTWLVAGDFNGKAVEWGMINTDSRGRRVLEMAARVGLNVINVGSTPTFRRPGCIGTIPDITLASEQIASKIEGWMVMEDYTGSDHQYIKYRLLGGSRTEINTEQHRNKWNAAQLNEEALIAEIESENSDVPEGDARTMVRRTMGIINRACNASMPRKTIYRNGNRKPVYWWTDEIAELRKTCLTHKRRLTRMRRTTPGEAEIENYKRARKNLKDAIRKSKRLRWEQLRSEVNSDPWGLGYKIVLRKLGAHTAGPIMETSKMEEIVDGLFPTHAIRQPDEFRQVEEIPLFSEEELQQAAKSLKNKKAPGPDGIPAEILKKLAQTSPHFLLKMYNRCLEEGVFPETWKVQRLVLISKGKGTPGTASAYRPLCMLDTAGKLLEKLLKPRLAEAIHNSGGLSERQYGFRPGRSTIGAIKDVVETFEATQQGNHFSRKVVLLATLDVKNAFNSARWADILHALENLFRVPEYLMRMVRSYLSNRELIYDTLDGLRRKQITSGAAQGSILGPDLWNISYDGILQMEMPENTSLIGYADDIVAVIIARNTEEAQRRLNQVMIRVKSWLDTHGLSLATEKTEIVLLTRRQIPTIVEMEVGPQTITTKNAVKYLGMYLDTKLSYWQQIRHAAEKAAKMTTSLSRLMANIGGPTQNKRKLLMNVTNAILLYGCEIWADALKKEMYRKQMAAVQRRGALRVISSYRTVSEPAVLVIAGVPPIDLMAQERKMIYHLKSRVGIEAAKSEAEEQTLRCWEERWKVDTRGRWTVRLVGDLRKWINRQHGEVNYYVTQLLTGHGYFRKYLHRMGKTRNMTCQYGDADQDDALHTFFACERWTTYRQTLETEVGAITPENIVGTMLYSNYNWNRVAEYVESVLRKKKQEESMEDMISRTPRVS